MRSSEKMLLNMSSTFFQKVRYAVQLSDMGMGVTVVTASIVSSTLGQQSWPHSKIHPRWGDGGTAPRGSCMLG